MQWIAPSEKDSATTTLEKRLWEAADQFRANSGLTAAQYSQPVLGLIFLRFAEVAPYSGQQLHVKPTSPSTIGGWLVTPTSIFTTPRPTLPGSTKWSAGSAF